MSSTEVNGRLQKILTFLNKFIQLEGLIFLQTLYWFRIYKKSGSKINTKFVKISTILAEWTEFIQKGQNLL